VYIVLGEGAFVTEPTVGQNRLVRVDEHGLTVLFAHERLEAERDPDGRGIDSNAGPVVVGTDGTIWTADSSGNWLAHLDSAGEVISLVVFPEVDGGPAIPTGVAVSPKGDVFVSLFRCRQPAAGRGGIVRIVPPHGYEIVVDGLNNPVAVAVGGDDTIYVAEFALDYRPRSGRLLAIRQGMRKVLMDGLSYPTSLAWDPRGFLWLATGSPGGESATGQLLRYRVR
jgi:sugar lactone lactonase YvrE